MKSSRAAPSSSLTRSACGTWTCSLLFGCLFFWRPRLEFEADFSVGLLHQERLEPAAFLGDEAGEEVRAAGLEELFHLLALDRLLQDHAAGAKVATALRADGFFAHIGDAVLEDARAALRAFSERFLTAEIGSFFI